MIRVVVAAFGFAIVLVLLTHSSTVGTVGFFAALVAIAVANVGKLKCPACRKRVKLGASRCHHCGENVTPLLFRR
jgi:uncharacterized protein (UPF0212 family)